MKTLLLTLFVALVLGISCSSFSGKVSENEPEQDTVVRSVRDRSGEYCEFFVVTKQDTSAYSCIFSSNDMYDRLSMSIYFDRTSKFCLDINAITADNDTTAFATGGVVDENDKKEAGINAKHFAKDDVKNRAYYNTLGAQLIKKFLASENVDATNTYNIHSIKKILEEFDIADLMLGNIHIDVRVIFNENFIFIPKSHFKYEILPDIYLVLLMSNDKKYVKFHRNSCEIKQNRL